MPDASTAVLTIDLAAIAENYKILSEQVAPAACGAAVKADAYGLGAAMVAPVLHRAGCEHFFTATLDEALALRPILSGANIYVLNGLPTGAAETIAGENLIPVLGTLAQIEEWGRFCRANLPRPAALMIDSGMSRLGLSEADMMRLAADPSLLQGFPVVHVMSHLACSDDEKSPM